MLSTMVAVDATLGPYLQTILQNILSIIQKWGYVYVLTDFRNASLSLTTRYDMYSLVRDSILIPQNNRFGVCLNILLAFTLYSTFYEFLYESVT